MNDIVKQVKSKLESDVAAASAALQQFPRGPDGRVTPEAKGGLAYRDAKRTYDVAFAALRAFNGKYLALTRTCVSRGM